MLRETGIAAVGALLGDRARTSMPEALLSGEATSACELARLAGVSRSGASAHLRKLRDGGLVTEEAAGRSRLFGLASPELAEALEALARIAPARPVAGLREAEATRALKRARTCYDHLAGELGVAVAKALVGRRVLRADDGDFFLTKTGDTWFRELGVDLEAQDVATELRARLSRLERAATASRRLARRGARRRAFRARPAATLPGGRAVAVTAAGETWLRDDLGLAPA